MNKNNNEQKCNCYTESPSDVSDVQDRLKLKENHRCITGNLGRCIICDNK